tara:strand:+ start:7318 stop:7674 length:357 start_codon:yes stop_codon:yes gene_type:complete
MDKHLSLNDYHSIIDMVNGTNEDIDLALEILKNHNNISSYITAMNLCSDKKKIICENIDRDKHFDTSIINIYNILIYQNKLDKYKELFKHIVLTRLENASKHSNLDENIKHIKLKLNV